jgi:hypothetical protein
LTERLLSAPRPLLRALLPPPRETAPACLRLVGELDGARALVRLSLAPLSRAATVDLVRGLVGTGRVSQDVGTLTEHLWLAGRRLQRLSETARHLAAVGSAVGRDFESRLLARAAALGEDVAAQGVDELVRRRILQASGERFEFTHDWLRTAAGAEIRPHRMRAIHLQIARAIESLYAGDRAPHHAAMGHHFRHRGMGRGGALPVRGTPSPSLVEPSRTRSTPHGSWRPEASARGSRGRGRAAGGR